jgi:hypothetical protein
MNYLEKKCRRKNFAHTRFNLKLAKISGSRRRRRRKSFFGAEAKETFGMWHQKPRQD